ncbi:MAG: tRNA adenosine(34) deaminase TadA [Acidobacteriota bacterium]
MIGNKDSDDDELAAQDRVDEEWMDFALRVAHEAAQRGEVPVGAVVVKDGEAVSWAGNRREEDQDPVAHAEILALRQAAQRLGSWRLEGCDLYVTLEPCAMCAGALVNARIQRLIYGAADPKAGFCGSLGNLVQEARLNHRMEVRRGVRSEASADLLRSFFQQLRSSK